MKNKYKAKKEVIYRKDGNRLKMKKKRERRKEKNNYLHLSKTSKSNIPCNQNDCDALFYFK